jgi:uncharacterized damage-inducible protein DinB
VTITVDLAELLHYSDHERAKWREWIAADPSRLSIPFQDGGRFSTVGSLFDHIFFAERRLLSRMQGATPPDATGVQAGDWKALFEYAGLVRADFRSAVLDLPEAEARQNMTVTTLSGARTMTKRWLATTIVLHEIRHLAQIAYAARRAGHAPPGEHDLFYCPELVQATGGH